MRTVSPHTDAECLLMQGCMRHAVWHERRWLLFVSSIIYSVNKERPARRDTNTRTRPLGTQAQCDEDVDGQFSARAGLLARSGRLTAAMPWLGPHVLSQPAEAALLDEAQG